MGRIPRKLLVAENTTNHVTFRSHNHMMLFSDEEIADHFLELLARHKGTYGILIHSYCLMGTHPHVVVTATLGQPAFSGFWKVVNHGLACFVNRKLERSGQVVMERMKSPTIAPDGRHLLTVMRYGDLNPVRANLCKSPGAWKRSSYRHYAYGETDELIDDAPDYVALGASPRVRRLAYRGLFAKKLDTGSTMTRCPAFVTAPFIGDPAWIAMKRRAAGLCGAPDG